ncbi:MAG: helix-hairpin-helix domain-containing protein [Bacteroidales bacterium]|jgi:hypothetical protein|nr:helix-hairpin-helix domain-containing protein [Bacteroidales bacterium]
MRKVLFAVSLISLIFPDLAMADPDYEYSYYILRLSGASDMSELDAGEVSRYMYYIRHPLEINTASVNRLIESGLFSGYQAASIVNYIKCSGDVLSVKELAAVDGFGAEKSLALMPFISFKSYSMPGSRPDTARRIDNSVTSRYSLRRIGSSSSYEGKYSLKADCLSAGKFEFSAGGGSSYGDPGVIPSSYTFSAAVYGRSHIDKFVMGDFNARFGQGIALWSGFSLSSLYEPGNFYRKASGISPVHSFSGTGSFRGVASDYSFGNFSISSFLAVNGLKKRMESGKRCPLSLIPALNTGYLLKNGIISVTGYYYPQTKSSGGKGLVSADFRYSIKGKEIYSEAALQLATFCPAIIAGCVVPLNGKTELGLMARYYVSGFESPFSGSFRSGSGNSGEIACSAGISRYSGEWIDLKGRDGFGQSVQKNIFSITADAAVYSGKQPPGSNVPLQCKILLKDSFQMASSFSWKIRMTERFRTYDGNHKFRTDLRSDCIYSDGKWSAACRGNILHFDGTGLLAYTDCGYSFRHIFVYGRYGLFKIEHWSDRIYVYERDAPGSFNVPARYGRGFWLSFVGGCKLRFPKYTTSLYLRLAHTESSRISNKNAFVRSVNTELKLQCYVGF